MGASPKAWARLEKYLRRTSLARQNIDPAIRPVQYRNMSGYIDELLDEWFDYQHRATEWDADQWGLSHEWTMLLNLLKAKPMVKGRDGRWYPAKYETRTSVVLKSPSSQ